MTREAEREIRRAKEENRRAAIWTAVLATLGTGDYESLKVSDIVEKLDAFSVEQLEELRAHEKQGKDRETLVEQIEQRIKLFS